MKNIRPIKTEEDYDWALGEIGRYFDNQPEPGSAEGDRFDVLATLIQAYEDEHYPIQSPDPVSAIIAHMDIYLDPQSLTQTLMADTSAMMSDMRPELIKDRDRFERIYRQLVDDLPLPERINRRVYRLFLLSLLNSVTNWYHPGRLSPKGIARQLFWMVRV